MTLPAFTVERCRPRGLRGACAVAAGRRRWPLSIGISCPHGAQQETRLTPLHVGLEAYAVPALLLLGAGAGRCRLVSPARTALSSKPASRRCCRSMGHTDGHLTVS